MHVFYLSLGSNLGFPKFNLNKAIALLGQESIDVLAVSRFYYSKPMGPSQNNFYNLVCRCFSSFSPLDILECVKNIEKVMGRARSLKWGPRLIDIDIIYCCGQDIDSDILVIPHAGCWERLFVLHPWLDVVEGEVLRTKINKALLLNRCRDIGSGWFC